MRYALSLKWFAWECLKCKVQFNKQGWRQADWHRVGVCLEVLLNENNFNMDVIQNLTNRRRCEEKQKGGHTLTRTRRYWEVLGACTNDIETWLKILVALRKLFAQSACKALLDVLQLCCRCPESQAKKVVQRECKSNDCDSPIVPTASKSRFLCL